MYTATEPDWWNELLSEYKPRKKYGSDGEASATRSTMLGLDTISEENSSSRSSSDLADDPTTSSSLSSDSSDSSNASDSEEERSE